MPADADLGRTDVARMISSYVRDDWYTAGDEGATVVDASTGEPVARVSSAGVDLAGMVEHARTVGGPGLRELTFHQRAGLLKQLGLRLMADKDEFYALSHRTGATDQRRRWVGPDEGVPGAATPPRTSVRTAQARPLWRLAAKRRHLD